MLGPCSFPVSGTYTVPMEMLIQRQKLRPGSGFLSVRVVTDGPTRVLQITDINQQVRFWIPCFMVIGRNWSLMASSWIECFDCQRYTSEDSGEWVKLQPVNKRPRLQSSESQEAPAPPTKRTEFEVRAYITFCHALLLSCITLFVLHSSGCDAHPNNLFL